MPANNIVWTNRMSARLLELLQEESAFYADIAVTLTREFGVELTKNACIGRGRRLRVPLRLPARKRPCQPRGELKNEHKNEHKNVPANSAPRQSMHWLNALKGRWQKRKLRAKQLPEERRAPLVHLTIVQLCPTSCRWPIGDRPPYLYCGKRKLDESSYCLEHARIATPGLFRR